MYELILAKLIYRYLSGCRCSQFATQVSERESDVTLYSAAVIARDLHYVLVIVGNISYMRCCLH